MASASCIPPTADLTSHCLYEPCICQVQVAQEQAVQIRNLQTAFCGYNLLHLCFWCCLLPSSCQLLILFALSLSSVVLVAADSVSRGPVTYAFTNQVRLGSLLCSV